MDWMFIGMVSAAVIMIVLGVLLLLRKTPTTPAAAIAPVEPALDGRAPVVPRDQRAALLDGLDAPAPTAQSASADALDDGLLDSPLSAKAFYTDLDQPTSADVDFSLSAQRDAVATPEHHAPQEHDLDDMLGDLAHATDQLVRPVEPTNLSDWQGDSDLINAHLQGQAERDEASVLAQAEQVIAVHLMPPIGRSLSGERVLHLLRQYGLRFGEMSLFHRFEESDGVGALMFSVLSYNAETGAGGFDLEVLEQQQLDGLSFFLALPSSKPAHGYDMMVSISGLLARDLSASLFDEQMMPFSAQLRTHYRHQVLEFRPNVA